MVVVLLWRLCVDGGGYVLVAIVWCCGVGG